MAQRYDGLLIDYVQTNNRLLLVKVDYKLDSFHYYNFDNYFHYCFDSFHYYLNRFDSLHSFGSYKFVCNILGLQWIKKNVNKLIFFNF